MPSLPTDVDYPLIAIGDLHGHIIWLDKLLLKLEKLVEWPAAKLVFLGDLVDRGPDVKKLVQRVIDLIEEKPGSTCVLGNHDLAFIQAAGLTQISDFWQGKYRSYDGSRQTFTSYLGHEPDLSSLQSWHASLRELHDVVPESHRQFFASLPWIAEASGHLFLHNGLSPELSEPASIQIELLRRKRWHGYVNPIIGTITAQEYKPEYPVWLGADKRLSHTPLPVPGRVQVTGHQRVEKPEVNAIRIRLDTSGGVKEPLTACLLRTPQDVPEFITSTD